MQKTFLLVGRGLTTAFLACMIVLISGCATMRGTGDGESSFMPDWGDTFALPPADSELTGLSSTSRQIERNLGVE